MKQSHKMSQTYTVQNVSLGTTLRSLSSQNTTTKL